MRARLFAAFAFATAMIALPAFAEGPVNPARSSIPMYDFPLKNGQARDEIYKMSEHKNGVFVFEALRLSCGYCNENAPAVDRLATEYASNPRVQVLDLSLDTLDYDISEWINRHHPNHPVIQDTGRRVYNALKVTNGVPQVFVVDCKGMMVGGHVGTWGGAERHIRSLVELALKTTCE
jgi:hypothetical protein